MILQLAFVFGCFVALHCCLLSFPLTPLLELTHGARASVQCDAGIKADAEDSADRDGEQGEPKTDAPIQPGNRASGSCANELVDPVFTVQAAAGDAATAAASDVATAGTG